MIREVLDITLHIKIGDFEYVELDLSGEASPEQVKEYYQQYSQPFQNGAGLPDDEWREAVDRYRIENKMDVQKHERMSQRQKWMVHEIDKSNTRLAYKASKQ